VILGPDRCAALSVARHEDLAGTASRVVRWVLVEQPGPWGREAVVDSRLDEATGQVLRSAGRRLGFRAVLIRRPGWGRGDGPRRVYLARTRPGGGWIEALDLDDVRQVVKIPWRALDATTPPGLGRPGPAPVFLVCTNGKHDPCCADLGRPVVRALSAAGTPEVWESSHVGGDRFAANVVCLPSGVYYGRVPPEEAAGGLDELARGLLRLEWLRGRSCFSPLTQAAEVFARRALGERRLDALRVVGTTRRGPDTLVVTVEHDGRRHEVTVSRHRIGEQLLTCGAAASRPWRYQLDTMEER
jgi:hypothetical protein